MIRVDVVTPDGHLLTDEAESLVIRNEEGMLGILSNHLPIVVVIDEGFVRLRRGDEKLYVTVIGGFLEFRNNFARIIAQEAHIGRDHISALEHLKAYRKQRLDENRQRLLDFMKMERELREQVKEIQAGKYL